MTKKNLPESNVIGGETREELEKAHDELYDEIVRDAIENYKRKCHEQSRHR